MPETNKSLFYNSENGDRVYDADSFEHLLKKFFTSGVFTGSCQVTADGTGMTCSVSAGYANCDGKIRVFDEETNLALENAHATYDRIDTVVVERNDTNREITCKIVKGAYSATPTATDPVRGNGIFQLVLAEVYIAAGVTEISQSVITDRRPITAVCGYVMSAVQTPDFSELYAQFEAQAEDWITVSTEEFADWFEHMRDQLDTDAAGHLQNQVDSLRLQNTLTNRFKSYIINEQDDYVADRNYSKGDWLCLDSNGVYVALQDIAEGESLLFPTEKVQLLNIPAINILKNMVDALNSDMESICITGPTSPTISANGTYTTSVAVTGLTSAHRVMRWGFSIGDENNPPADIELTPLDSGTYTVVVTNYGGTAFTMTPVFILPMS